MRREKKGNIRTNKTIKECHNCRKCWNNNRDITSMKELLSKGSVHQDGTLKAFDKRAHKCHRRNSIYSYPKNPEHAGRRKKRQAADYEANLHKQVIKMVQ